MVASGQPHAPAFCPLGKDLLLPNEQETAWSTETACMFSGREKSVARAWIQTPGCTPRCLNFVPSALSINLQGRLE